MSLNDLIFSEMYTATGGPNGALAHGSGRQAHGPGGIAQGPDVHVVQGSNHNRVQGPQADIAVFSDACRSSVKLQTDNNILYTEI